MSNPSFVARQTVQSLDDKCGRFFSYRDLVNCGATQSALGIDNTPENPESYADIRDLATNIIDPVVEHFGRIRLTFGFCSNNLRRHIKARIAPHLDQHAAHEVSAKGKLVCSRQGAAVDFIVEGADMSDVVKWISKNLAFDRIYYYGQDRPIHVSFSKKPAREITELRRTKSGRQVPQKFVMD